MKVLFLGDIVGRAARGAVIEQLPDLRTELALTRLLSIARMPQVDLALRLPFVMISLPLVQMCSPQETMCGIKLRSRPISPSNHASCDLPIWRANFRFRRCDCAFGRWQTSGCDECDV